MTLFSKDTAGIILLLDTFGNHLDKSNKTNDLNHEIKNFEVAGKILTEIWSGSTIDSHPVIASCTCPPKKQHNEVIFYKCEEWKAKSQYVLQIIKCSDASCCKAWKTNYPTFFPQQSLPVSVPVAKSENNLKIDQAKSSFRSLFD